MSFTFEMDIGKGVLAIDIYNFIRAYNKLQFFPGIGMEVNQGIFDVRMCLALTPLHLKCNINNIYINLLTNSIVGITAYKLLALKPKQTNNTYDSIAKTIFFIL